MGAVDPAQSPRMGSLITAPAAGLRAGLVRARTHCLRGALVVSTLLGCTTEDPAAAGAPTEDISGPLAPALGGERQVGPVRLLLAPRQFAGNDTVTATPATAPMPLPDGMRAAGPSVDIHVMDPSALTAPLTVEMPYDPAMVSDPSDLGVMRFDAERGAWEPHTVVGVDPQRRVVIFRARRFSIASVIAWAQDLAGDFSVTGFAPAEDTWAFPNFASPLSPGMCFGMAGMVQWYFPQARASGFSSRPHLVARFADVEKARGLVHRAQLATNVTSSSMVRWAQDLNAPPAQNTLNLPKLLRNTLRTADEPLVMLVRSGQSAGDAHAQHALVLYGFVRQGLSAGHFLAYDPNTPGTVVQVPWQGNRFLPLTLGVYTYTAFAYLTKTAQPYEQSLQALVAAYDEGFSADQNVLWVEPQGEMASASMPVQQIDIGTMEEFWSVDGIDPREGFGMYFSLGTSTWQMERTAGGIFRTYVPVLPGANEASIVGGVSVGRLMSEGARAYNVATAAATTRVRFQGTIPRAPSVIVVATWDTPQVDLDIFAVPRRAPWDYIYWGRRQTDRGTIALDSRNQGPEYFSITPGENDNIPDEFYRIRLHLHSIMSEIPIALGITANATAFTGIGTAQMRRVPITVYFERRPNPGNTAANAQGPDWANLFDVNPRTGEVRRLCQRGQTPARDGCTAP